MTREEIVGAIHEGFNRVTPSDSTIEMVDDLSGRVGNLDKRVASLEGKIDTLLDILGNLKFSGKAALLVFSGMIGIVALFTSLKAILGWFGYQLMK